MEPTSFPDSPDLEVGMAYGRLHSHQYISLVKTKFLKSETDCILLPQCLVC